MDKPALSGYTPGDIGSITELHGSYYQKHWRLGLFFEAKVATELAEFLLRFDPKHDGFWAARMAGTVVGSIAIDGYAAATHGARLRWFIVDPDHQGYGIGKMLLDAAIAFCHHARFQRVYLTTFAGLDAARHLYEQVGFILVEEREDTHWGSKVLEQTFALMV